MDILNKIFKIDFIDKFHNYTDPYNNIRYYHYLKYLIVNNFITNNSSKEKILLDAGAGRGPYTYLAKNKFKKIFCFEYNENELSIAIKNVGTDSSILYNKVDLTNIPLESNSVDIIICSEVLEHIGDYNKAISELYRILKNDGKILISIPNSFSLFYLKVKIKYRNIINKEKSLITKDEWEFLRHLEFPFYKTEKIIKKHKFKVSKRYGANIIPINYKLRKILMNKFQKIFIIYNYINIKLAKIFPYFCSFYFIEIKK